MTNFAHTRYETGQFFAQVACNKFSLFFLSFFFYLFRIIDKVKKIYSVIITDNT